jgi:hypothetical protein
MLLQACRPANLTHSPEAQPMQSAAATGYASYGTSQLTPVTLPALMLRYNDQHASSCRRKCLASMPHGLSAPAWWYGVVCGMVWCVHWCGVYIGVVCTLVWCVHQHGGVVCTVGSHRGHNHVPTQGAQATPLVQSCSAQLGRHERRHNANKEHHKHPSTTTQQMHVAAWHHIVKSVGMT